MNNEPASSRLHEHQPDALTLLRERLIVSAIAGAATHMVYGDDAITFSRRAIALADEVIARLAREEKERET